MRTRGKKVRKCKNFVDIISGSPKAVYLLLHAAPAPKQRILHLQRSMNIYRGRQHFYCPFIADSWGFKERALWRGEMSLTWPNEQERDKENCGPKFCARPSQGAALMGEHQLDHFTSPFTSPLLCAVSIPFTLCVIAAPISQ